MSLIASFVLCRVDRTWADFRYYDYFTYDLGEMISESLLSFAHGP